MAQRRIVHYKVCDRCKTETRATETHRLTLDGNAYDLDLCDAHSARLYGGVMAWADLGKQVREASVFDKPKLVAAERVVEVPRPTGPDRTGEKLGELAKQWKVSDHARERMAQRDVSVDEALLAAAHATRVEPGVREGTYRRTRGDVEVVTTDREIVTVYRLSHTSTRRAL